MSRITVAASSDVRENEVHVVKHCNVSVALTRIKGTVRAFENRCPHLGLALARGKIENGAIRCPWHGSTFDVCSGRNLDWVNSVVGVPMPQWTHKLIALGKDAAPIRVFEAEEENGKVTLEAIS